MKLVLLGAPGSGKGTQASKISGRYGLPHISTGDIFRENISAKTEIGLRIKKIIDGGDLAPDDITIEIVKERLSAKDCEGGYVLDGFPRNLAQAEALEGFDPPDAVIFIDIPLHKLERRLTGRRSCKVCKGSFHVDFIDDEKTCPDCGGELFIRKDDSTDAVRERFAVYEEQTRPLEDFYWKKGRLKAVNGDNGAEDVFAEIVRAIEGEK